MAVEHQYKNANSVPVVRNYALETNKLIQRLKDGMPGDIVTDDEMSDLIGKSTQPGGAGYNYLQSAMRYCLHQGVRWERMRKQRAIKCLDSSETLKHGERGIKLLGRAARRETRKIGTVKRAELSQEESKRFGVVSSQLQTLTYMSSKPAAKRLDTKVWADKSPRKMLDALLDKPKDEAGEE